MAAGNICNTTSKSHYGAEQAYKKYIQSDGAYASTQRNIDNESQMGDSFHPDIEIDPHIEHHSDGMPPTQECSIMSKRHTGLTRSRNSTSHYCNESVVVDNRCEVGCEPFLL